MYHLLTYNIHIPCDKETDLGFKLIAQYNVKIHHHKMCQTLTIMIILTKSWPERKRAFTITLIVMISKHGLYLTLPLWKGLTLALLHRWWWSTNITLTLHFSSERFCGPTLELPSTKAWRGQWPSEMRNKWCDKYHGNETNQKLFSFPNQPYLIWSKQV